MFAFRIRGVRVKRSMAQWLRGGLASSGGIIVLLLLGGAVPAADAAVGWSSPTQLELPSGASAGTEGELLSTSCYAIGSCTAVGSFGAGEEEAPMTISEEGASWQPARAIALPANTAVGPTGVLEHVSCSAPGYCAAVGVYQDSRGEFEPMAASEIAGVWGPASQIQLPGDEEGRHSRSEPLFSSLSCSGPDDCASVGNYAKGGLGEPTGMFVTSTDGVWQTQATRVQFPHGFSEGRTDLASVSCWAPGSCSAVGHYGSGTAARAMFMTETAGAWSTLEPAPDPADRHVESDSFASIACFGAGECEASGSLLEGSSAYAIVDDERDGVWQPGLVLAPPPGSERELGVSLGQVACGSEQLCVAAGFRGVEEGWVAAFTNGQWGALQLLVLPNGLPRRPHSKVDGVACASADCTAIGEFEEANGTRQLMLVSASAYGWDTLASVIGLPGGAYANLRGISCSPAGNCDAVGGLESTSSGPILPMVLSTGEPSPPSTPSPSSTASPGAPQPSAGGGPGRAASSLAVIASAGAAGFVLKLLAPLQCTAPDALTSLKLSSARATRHASGYTISHVSLYVDGGARATIQGPHGRRRVVHRPQFQSSYALAFTFEPSKLHLHRGANEVLALVTLRRVQTIDHRRVVRMIIKRLTGTFRVC